MAVRYRNRDTGHVATFSHPNRRLAGSDRWELVVEDDATPARSATKGEWVEFAASQGVDVEGLTKDEIVELLGG